MTTRVTFTDASGKESVTIKKNPENVVNLYASFTTLWYEAGGKVAGLHRRRVLPSRFMRSTSDGI